MSTEDGKAFVITLEPPKDSRLGDYDALPGWLKEIWQQIEDPAVVYKWWHKDGIDEDGTGVYAVSYLRALRKREVDRLNSLGGNFSELTPL